MSSISTNPLPVQEEHDLNNDCIKGQAQVTGGKNGTIFIGVSCLEDYSEHGPRRFKAGRSRSLANRNDSHVEKLSFWKFLEF